MPACLPFPSLPHSFIKGPSIRFIIEWMGSVRPMCGPLEGSTWHNNKKRRKKERSQCSVTMWESAEQHLKCFFCITNETREGSSSSSSCFALLKMDRLRGDKKARRVWESHYYFCFYNWKRAIEGECCCSAAAAAAGLVVTRTGRRSFVNAALSSQRYQSCKLD